MFLRDSSVDFLKIIFYYEVVYLYIVCYNEVLFVTYSTIEHFGPVLCVSCAL